MWNVDDLARGNLIAHNGWVLSNVSETWWLPNDRCYGKLGKCGVSI